MGAISTATATAPRSRVASKAVVNLRRKKMLTLNTLCMVVCSASILAPQDPSDRTREAEGKWRRGRDETSRTNERTNDRASGDLYWFSTALQCRMQVTRLRRSHGIFFASARRNAGLLNPFRGAFFFYQPPKGGRGGELRVLASDWGKFWPPQGIERRRQVGWCWWVHKAEAEAGFCFGR